MKSVTLLSVTAAIAVRLAWESACRRFRDRCHATAPPEPCGHLSVLLTASFYEPINGPRTHPLSADRIRAAASEMRKTPDAFVAPQSQAPSKDRGAVLQIAENLESHREQLEEIQTPRGAIESRTGNLAGTNSQTFPTIDFTRACPQGRKN